jgi:hypothetical protein
MTTREWQPGDVVARPGGIRGIVAERGPGCGPHLMPGDVLHVHYSDGDWDLATDAIRPLVVIDPEDREQVERLVDSILQHGYEFRDGGTSDLAAALREFASPTPPKPDEPTGLGAVVEDAQGALHVLTPRTREADAPEACWIDRLGDFRSWDAIDVVKVLDNGYKPGEPS